MNTVEAFEEELTTALSNDSSLNGFSDFLHFVGNSDHPKTVYKGIYAMYRLFSLSIRKRRLDLGSSGNSEVKAVGVWLREKLERFSLLLQGYLHDEDENLRNASLRIFFGLLKQLSDYDDLLTQLFKVIVQGLLLCPQSKRCSTASADRFLELDVRDTLVDDWLSKYADLRWYYFRASGALLLQQPVITSNPQVPKNALFIIEKLASTQLQITDISNRWLGDSAALPNHSKGSIPAGSDQPAEDDWRTFFDSQMDDEDEVGGEKANTRRVHAMTVHEQIRSVPAHKTMFTKCWLALLPCLSSLPVDDTREDLVKRALSVFHRGVMPYMTRPILLMDWVAGCVDFGGSVAVLALNALFSLMKDYNLDYPQFYTRLYALLDRDVLYLKHRSRFFRLTELCLQSTHLPATLLASFIKKLSRLSLSASPAAIVLIIPFTYNILKRHPALMVMIHRTGDSPDDPFDVTEQNPTQTNAIESSLWELYSHKIHYHTSVATMARIFEEVFTKPSYALEDFLDHTYMTLLETELKRKIKKEPAVVDQSLFLPQSLSPPEDITHSTWVLA
ncbi:CBF-domain-containing protein [Rickenella mellea]|uniref:CBF-domain-containing protein n=1 Tax=Rickenella mellea TaxID=50990 RepID=A0A4Y7QFG8_9AGAM|nr:CBF-domain-containing protein [Rickenella mellea]